MAALELETLTAPVSDDEPCGPDLDLGGDLDYMNFMARAEGLLPAAFFRRDGKPFDRATIDFLAEFEAANAFLEQTRDLRLLTLLARFNVLNRDLAGFEVCVRAIGVLLAEQWEAVHPRSEDGDLTIRMAALETLDDTPTVMLPLQFVPLANSRRIGALTFRHYLIAIGEARAPEGGDEEQQVLDVTDIDKILMETELEPLVATLREFEATREALSNIRKTWLEKANFDQVPTIEKAPQLIGRIIALLQGVAVKRDPSLAPAEPEPAAGAAADGVSAAHSTVLSGSVKSAADAAAALAAAAGYFSRLEPSSPALLLVRQAEQLIGKSFVEVMQLMLPAYVGQAAVAIGTPLPFQVSVEALSTVLQNAAWSGTETPAAEETPDAAVTEQPEPRVFRAGSRHDAVALLDQVGTFYRSAEPSSPIAVIVERARRLADRDFMGLLQDFLPDNFKPSV